MTRPRIAQSVPLPRPYVAGKDFSLPTNADAIGKALTNRKQIATVGGVAEPVETLALIRQLAMGNDGDRAFLKNLWESMDEKQQETLIGKMIESSPHPQFPGGYPKGHPMEGKQAFSPEVQKMMDIIRGEPDAETLKAADAGEGTRVPKRRTEGPSRNRTEEDGPEGSEEVDQDAGSTTAGSSSTLTLPAPGKTASPDPLRTLPKDEKFDPKAAGVHDPTANPIRPRQNFRVSKKLAKDESGNFVVKPDGKDVSLTTADKAAMDRGVQYEKGWQERQQLISQLIVAKTGSEDAALDLMRRYHEGDEEAADTLNQIRAIADKTNPIPQKPFPIRDVDASAGESTPQAQFDNLIKGITEGSPASSVYAPRRGSRDSLMDAWKQLQVNGEKGRGWNPFPNQTFSSPRQMAEQLIRNARPELFDVTPITPSQRMQAGDTVRGFDLKNPEQAKQYMAILDSGLPISPKDREVFRNQTIDLFERLIRERFGEQWGDGARTTTPVDPASMSPAPASSEPASPSGTSMDPASLPKEGVRDMRGLGRGIPNKAGTKPTKSFESRLEEQINSPSPKATQSFYADEHGENAPAAFEEWRKQAEGAGLKIEQQEDGVFIARDPSQPVEAGEAETFKTFGGVRKTFGELDGPEQHKVAYRNFKDGEYKPGAGSSFEDWFADYNRRNPILTDENMATRSRMIDEMSDRLPGLQGAGDLRTSELLKQIDELESQIDNYPEEVTKLEAQLQAEGITPSQAKAIREQLKPLYKAHEDSIAGKTDELKRLRALLPKSQQADALTGIQSAKKPPLSGKIGKGKGKGAAEGPTKTTQQKVMDEAAEEAQAATPNPADTQPAAPPPEVKVEDDGAVIEGRPDPGTGIVPSGPRRAMDDLPNFRRRFNSDDPSSPDYIPPVNGAGVPDGSWVDEPPGPSGPRAAPTDDVIDAEFEVVNDRMSGSHASDVGDGTEAESASRVDAAEAPRDAEAARPEAEAETIPKGTGDESTPDDAAVKAGDPAANPAATPAATPGKPNGGKPNNAQPQPQTPANKGWRVPWKSGAAVLAGGAGLYGLNQLGISLSNQQSASGQEGMGSGMGMPGPGGMGPDGMGAGGAPQAEPPLMPKEMDSASRIRLLQALQKSNSRIPSGIPQTAQQWR